MTPDTFAFVPPTWLLQGAVAAVWLYEGLWSKLMGGQRHEFEVVEQVPFFTPALAAGVLRAIGALECVLALWVLSGWLPWWCAAAQTAVLIGLNSGGLLWARHVIPDPPGMVVKNFAFLLLAWVTAAQLAAR